MHSLQTTSYHIVKKVYIYLFFSNISLNFGISNSAVAASKQFLDDIAINILSSNIRLSRVLSLVNLPRDKLSKSCVYSDAETLPLAIGSKILHHIIIS